MGLSGGSNKTYVQIINSQFAVKTTESDKAGVQRKNKDNKIVYERLYSKLDGLITKIDYQVTKFGKRIDIDIDDGKDTFTLQIPFDSYGVRTAFIKVLPRINFSGSVNMSVFKGDKGTVLVVRQAGEIIRQKYTKDNPEGIPQPVEQMVLGEKKWDYSEQERFLYNVLMEEIARCANVNVQPDNIDFNQLSETDDGIFQGSDTPPF